MALDHAVLLYGNDRRALAQQATTYFAEALDAGGAVVILATAANASLFRRALERRDPDIARAVREGRFVVFDAAQLRRKIISDGSLDPVAFLSFMKPQLSALAASYDVRVYGELVGLLWSDGEREAAIELEHAWNALRELVPFRLLCAYPIDVFSDEFNQETIDGVMRTHGRLVSVHQELLQTLEQTSGRSLERSHVPAEWGSIPEGEASILWLRKHESHEGRELIRRAQTSVREHHLKSFDGGESRDQERLELLVRAGEMFHQSLDVTTTLNNVARLAVESFAEICLFDLIDERSERLFVTASAHRDPTREEALAGISNVLYVEEFGVHPVVRVTQTGEPFFLPHIDDKVLMAHAASRQHEQYMRRFGYRSKIVVPVIAQNHIFGALTFVRTSEAREFDQADLLFAIELGRRAGLAVANAKQFHREQYVAETLQRAFLPRQFPSGKGMEVSAHYRPGSTEADIGGDWYDAFENNHGEVVVTIGDVTGKGIEAARLMVLMRQAIRIAAFTARDPREIASIANRLLISEGDRLASAFVGVIDPATRMMRYTSAGHAPPLIRQRDGTLLRLESPSPPLGAFPTTIFEQHEIACPKDSMLVLYTDGVIEISRDILAGEDMLARVLSTEAAVHASNPAEFIERAIAYEPPRDDIAILCVNFADPQLRWQFAAADARSAYTLRGEYLKSLQQVCNASDDDLSECGLIFAELIGNVVRHAPGALSFSLEQRDGDIILHVIDKGPGFEYAPSLPANVWAESGRGLYLISRLARDVKVERLPGMGSHIAVTLPLACDAEALPSNVA